MRAVSESTRRKTGGSDVIQSRPSVSIAPGTLQTQAGIPSRSNPAESQAPFIASGWNEGELEIGFPHFLKEVTLLEMGRGGIPGNAQVVDPASAASVPVQNCKNPEYKNSPFLK